MKINEKKQTLILLLILIFMIGILILYPFVNISLNQKNEDELKNNVIKIINEVDKYYKENTIFEEEYQMFTIDNYNIVEEGLIIKEKLPKSGHIYINKNGKIQIIANDGKYCIIKKYNDNDVSVTNDNDCKLIESTKLGNINVVINEDNSNGLYRNDTDYIYRGSNPDNYIMIMNEMYRIIKINKLGYITIIKNNNIGDFKWDIDNNYNVSLMRESNILYYLNNNMDLINVRKNINFVENEYSSNTLDSDNLLDVQKYNKFSSIISLINVNDYVNASLDTLCKKNIYRNDACGNNNWLKDKEDYFSIDKSSDSVYAISSDGRIYESQSDNILSIRPVYTLKPDITLKGKGTIGNPYIIINK